MPAAPRVLTVRELNRAVLARQLLLCRTRATPAGAIDRLTPLQAQWSPAPYVGLWSRLAGFRAAHLAHALEQRAIVKATLMRGTLHLVSAREYPFYATVHAVAHRALWAPLAARARLDVDAVEEALVRFAGDVPRPRAELLQFIEENAGGYDRAALPFGPGRLMSSRTGFLHAPQSAQWAPARTVALVLARAWLGDHAVPDEEAAHVHVVRRYLGAFGPASVADLASWSRSRQAPLRAAVAALRDELIELRDERGRLLYDLARAPRPRAEVPAPVRFLPKWDQLLLAYATTERVRVLPEAYRKAVIALNGDVVPTVLVDGMVAARWDARLTGGLATLTVEPLGRLAGAARDEIEAEGLRLLRFTHPGTTTRRVRIAKATLAPRWNLQLRP